MEPAVEDVSPEEAEALIAAGALIVDVREQDEWDAGRIEGALHFPLSTLQARWQELPDAERTVFVCRSGGRSMMAAEAFAAAGRAGCANLMGGAQAWAAAGRPFSGRVA
ncbi:MAG: rhodanese-like domain-containing protein [Gaiellales bacterium]|jgi:rhodanese-related sulfurtransferase